MGPKSIPVGAGGDTGGRGGGSDGGCGGGDGGCLIGQDDSMAPPTRRNVQTVPSLPSRLIFGMSPLILRCAPESADVCEETPLVMNVPTSTMKTCGKAHEAVGIATRRREVCLTYL